MVKKLDKKLTKDQSGEKFLSLKKFIEYKI